MKITERRGGGEDADEFRLAVCDDEELYIDRICRHLEVYERESGNRLIVEPYSSAQALLEEFKGGEKQYDLLFLDVDMPKMKGTDAALLVRDHDQQFQSALSQAMRSMPLPHLWQMPSAIW